MRTHGDQPRGRGRLPNWNDDKRREVCVHSVRKGLRGNSSKISARGDGRAGRNQRWSFDDRWGPPLLHRRVGPPRLEQRCCPATSIRWPTCLSPDAWVDPAGVRVAGIARRQPTSWSRDSSYEAKGGRPMGMGGRFALWGAEAQPPRGLCCTRYVVGHSGLEAHAGRPECECAEF